MQFTKTLNAVIKSSNGSGSSPLKESLQRLLDSRYSKEDEIDQDDKTVARGLVSETLLEREESLSSDKRSMLEGSESKDTGMNLDGQERHYKEELSSSNKSDLESKETNSEPSRERDPLLSEIESFDVTKLNSLKKEEKTLLKNLGESVLESLKCINLAVYGDSDSESEEENDANSSWMEEED